MEILTPRLEILPTQQRRLWDELIDVPADFTLCGGTAIALHLGHRESVAFDFHRSEPFDPDAILTAVPFLEQARVQQRMANTLTAIVDRGGPVPAKPSATMRSGRASNKPLLASWTAAHGLVGISCRSGP